MPTEASRQINALQSAWVGPGRSGQLLFCSVSFPVGGHFLHIRNFVLLHENLWTKPTRGICHFSGGGVVDVYHLS